MIELPPFKNEKGWVSAPEAARIFKRSRVTIHNWAKDGTLDEFGIKYYKDIKNHLYLKLSEDDLNVKKKKVVNIAT